MSIEIKDFENAFNSDGFIMQRQKQESRNDEEITFRERPLTAENASKKGELYFSPQKNSNEKWK